MMISSSRRRLALGLSILAVTGVGGGAAFAAGGSGDVTPADTPRAVKGDVSRADEAGTSVSKLAKKDPRRANGAVIAAAKAGDIQGQVERAPMPGNDARPVPAP